MASPPKRESFFKAPVYPLSEGERDYYVFFVVPERIQVVSNMFGC